MNRTSKMCLITLVAMLLFIGAGIAEEIVYVEETMNTDPNDNGWFVREGTMGNYTLEEGVMNWPDNGTSWGVLDYYLVEEGNESELYGVWTVDLVWRADSPDGIGIYIGTVNHDQSDKATINLMAHSDSETGQTVMIQKGNHSLSNDAVIPGFSTGFITGRLLIDPINERVLYWLDDGTHSDSGWVKLDWEGSADIGRRVSIAAKTGCQGQIDYLKVSRFTGTIDVGDIDVDGTVDLIDYSVFAPKWLQDNYVEVPAKEVGNLVAWWKFDEGTGDVAYDYSGNNYDATITGFGPHVWDTAGGIYFDGYYNTNYATCAGLGISTDGESLDEITLSFWAKGDVGADNDVNILWAYDLAGNSVLKGYFPFYRGEPYNEIQYQVQYVGPEGNEQAVYISSLEESRDGQWHHWAFQKDVSEGVMNVYCDGVVVATRSGSKPIFPIHHLRIGSNASAGGAYEGYVKDFRIYDYFLDSEEIATVKDGGHPVLPVDPNDPGDEYLIGWWKFDEGSGSTVSDSSGNDWTGSVVGSGPHVWDAQGGIYVDAHQNTNYVSIPNIDISRNSGSFYEITVAFWAKGDSDTEGSAAVLWSTGGPDNSVNPLKCYFPYYNTTISQNQYQIQYTGPNGMETGPYNSTLGESRDGQWHHWVFQKDADATNGQVRVYLDGVLVGSRSNTNKPVWPVTELKFGGNGDASWAYKGYLKDLQIYNYFLDETEIAQIIQGQIPAPLISEMPEESNPSTFECVENTFFPQDLTGDCYVDTDDLVILAQNWLSNN